MFLRGLFSLSLIVDRNHHSSMIQNPFNPSDPSLESARFLAPLVSWRFIAYTVSFFRVSGLESRL